MKAANEQMRQGADGLFNELGTAMSGSPLGKGKDQISRHVDTLVAKSDSGKSRELLEAEFLLTPLGRRMYAESTNHN